MVSLAWAQPLVWQTSRDDAIARANSEGKLVLLLAGRHTCGNCNYMQNTVCETTTPPIKQLIQNNFIPWLCVVDDSSEWRQYATGLGGFTLPLISCLDPEHPGVYLDRTTSTQSPAAFYARLSSIVANNKPRVEVTQCWLQNNRVNLRFSNVRNGQALAIERSTDLKTWEPVANIVCSDTAATWSEDLHSRGVSFYRVRQ